MEQNSLFCTFCGTANPAQAKNCSGCGHELIQPHPIQLEGGRVYMLHCTGCGAPIPVLTKNGGVACSQCGLYHNIEAGQGYITLRATPTGKPSQNEVEQTSAFFSPGNESTTQSIPVVPPLPADNQKLEKQARLALLQKELVKKEKAIERRKKNRVLSIIYLIVAPILFFLSGYYLSQNREMDTTALGLFALVLCIFFLAGIVGVIVNNRRRTTRLQVDLNPLYAEVEQLKKELQQAQ